MWEVRSGGDENPSDIYLVPDGSLKYCLLEAAAAASRSSVPAPCSEWVFKVAAHINVENMFVLNSSLVSCFCILCLFYLYLVKQFHLQTLSRRSCVKPELRCKVSSSGSGCFVCFGKLQLFDSQKIMEGHFT